LERESSERREQTNEGITPLLFMALGVGGKVNRGTNLERQIQLRGTT